VISEKTVELNLTTEFMNWMWKVHGTTYTAIAPSQRQEARLGFDVSIRASGYAFFIQYKRAHRNGTVYSYQLNRTSAKDQHRKLCDLERTGVPDFYALPQFATVGEVMGYRRQLLIHTLWLRPSAIPIPGGGIGHHDVHYDEFTRRYWVTSKQEIPFNPKESGLEVFDKVLEYQGIIDNFLESQIAFNKIFLGSKDGANVDDIKDIKIDLEDLGGIALMTNATIDLAAHL
jgi:hypothetical protein